MGDKEEVWTKFYAELPNIPDEDLIKWHLDSKFKLILLAVDVDENKKLWYGPIKTFTKREVANLIKMLYYYKKQMKD